MHMRLAFVLALSAACHSGGSGLGDAGTAGDPQTPPTTNATDIDTWLAKGDYKNWHCEAQPSVKSGGASSIHAHGATRICSNDALSAASSSGEFPVGAAAVKELWDSATTQVNGHAVYLHVSAGDGASCANYFYYERANVGSSPTIGIGNGVCAGCHGGAGSDAMHLAPIAHDCVYTIEK